jgi:hypothetical protein
MSGRFDIAFVTDTVVGVVDMPCGMLKTTVVPSPENVFTPPFVSTGVRLFSSFKASTTEFHSSGVRICGKSRR